MGILFSVQLIAVLKPRAEWTIKNVYSSDPSKTDPKAYFAVNQGYAWADVAFWAPIQIAGSIGMLLGFHWGFLMALVGSVPFVYSAITLFIWDRDMGFRKNNVSYWFTWGMFPAFGMAEMVYCFGRLLGDQPLSFSRVISREYAADEPFPAIVRSQHRIQHEAPQLDPSAPLFSPAGIRQ